MLLSYINPAAIVLLTSAFLLGIFFIFLYRQKQQQYLVVWSAGWLLLTIHLSISLIARYPVPSAAWLYALDQWFFAVAGLVFYCAARLYAKSSPAIRFLTAAAAGAAVWAVAHAQGYFPIPFEVGIGLIFLLVAWTFWQAGRKQESSADRILGVTFAAWALLCLVRPLGPRFAGAANNEAPYAVFLPLLFAGLLMVMAVYEEERRRIERNMLALSNLNLATSSFTGGEIQKMLAQALDRVLNVVRVPAGALCLNYGETNGPASVVATGLSETFCSAIRESGLDDYIVGLVARLGGLVTLANLANDAEYVALEKEESFRRARQLLLAQGLRNVVALSLQGKERVFGMLLLGAIDDRTFTPAELRLLLGLGHQIGMAVENSYLVQQTARRSEEVHILNEIGRALSSTLDLDSLLERICSEMRRLVGEGSFFIAFDEPKTAEIRFEIEVADGERLPKRSRPAGNHLVEHVLRTRQPLLIRDHYREETQRLGFVPLRQVGSMCAVPVILYDRAVGVMEVHSPRERMFDEGHVELLRVLASEAGIAIENARLFSEEEKKSRQLTLINAVSSHAITTLNSSEMLAKIVVEIENSLACDHIGVAVLDYATKELVVEAEAGRRREAAGRRISLGEGLIGQVARTGQVSMVREANPSAPRLLLAESVSSIALPVVYGDQLLGVLYVESSEPCDFPQADVLLLRTLADLFAGALHNVLTFQKAQEQAITDGLTGAKTHRFLMEALSAEWKRSTRSSRPFALVLMDLDRFKFVNDFYGHLEGDVVLQRVAQILEQNCRRSDVVARYGGDEFVILMPETSVEQSRQLAGKLRGWVASDPLLRDKNVTASFGVAGFPVHGSTPQELIQVADSAMYLSKHQGGNSVSSAEEGDPSDQNRWKKDVLEAYLGVTLKRQFATGPEAFEEITCRLRQFTASLGRHGIEDSDEAPPAAVVDTVTSLALAIDAKDRYTQGHSRKVSSYAVILAQGLGMEAAEIEEIRLAAMLHDIGKVGIPEAILNKSGPLDASEWETMKTHTELGARILEPLRSLIRVREMIRHHHEFYDGSGYPMRLEGDRIPFGSRMIAIADAFDTITSERTYKKARTSEEAFAELERCAPSQFDPELVRAFIEAMRQASSGEPPANERTIFSGL